MRHIPLESGVKSRFPGLVIRHGACSTTEAEGSRAMEFNKLVFAGLAVGCLAAAAGGSYLAVRQNQTYAGEAREASEAGAPASAASPASPATVTESEGVISPEAAKPAPSRPEESIERARPASRIVNTPTRRASNTQPVTRAPQASQPPRAANTPASSQSAPFSAAPEPNGNGGYESRPSAPAPVSAVREPEPFDSAQGRPPAPPPPPAPEYVDLTVPSDAVLGLQIERTVSSELARVEDRVEARVTRDVRVEDRIAIPAGSTVRGSVTEVDRGGRMKGKARLAIRFHTIVLADGTELALKTDPVVREGQSPGGESAAKVGGAAIGGAILGAILGGGKGAAIGGAVGAAGGTAAAMSNDRNPATLTAGTTVTVRMQAPVTVTVQKN